MLSSRMHSPCSSHTSRNYESCIKINGVPILPPLISNDDRKLILKYKNQAIAVERRLEFIKNLKSKNISQNANQFDLQTKSTIRQTVPRTKVHNQTVEKLKTSICKSPKCKKLKQGVSAISSPKKSKELNISHISNETLSPRVRKNSYTLEAPTPEIIEHLNALQNQNEQSVQSLEHTFSSIQKEKNDCLKHLNNLNRNIHITSHYNDQCVKHQSTNLSPSDQLNYFPNYLSNEMFLLNNNFNHQNDYINSIENRLSDSIQMAKDLVNSINSISSVTNQNNVEENPVFDPKYSHNIKENTILHSTNKDSNEDNLITSNLNTSGFDDYCSEKTYPNDQVKDVLTENNLFKNKPSHRRKWNLKEAKRLWENLELKIPLEDDDSNEQKTKSLPTSLRNSPTLQYNETLSWSLNCLPDSISSNSNRSYSLEKPMTSLNVEKIQKGNLSSSNLEDFNLCSYYLNLYKDMSQFITQEGTLLVENIEQSRPLQQATSSNEVKDQIYVTETHNDDTMSEVCNPCDVPNISNDSDISNKETTPDPIQEHVSLPTNSSPASCDSKSTCETYLESSLAKDDLIQFEEPSIDSNMRIPNNFKDPVTFNREELDMLHNMNHTELCNIIDIDLSKLTIPNYQRCNDETSNKNNSEIQHRINTKLFETQPDTFIPNDYPNTFKDGINYATYVVDMNETTDVFTNDIEMRKDILNKIVLDNLQNENVGRDETVPKWKDVFNANNMIDSLESILNKENISKETSNINVSRESSRTSLNSSNEIPMSFDSNKTMASIYKTQHNMSSNSPHTLLYDISNTPKLVPEIESSYYSSPENSSTHSSAHVSLEYIKQKYLLTPNDVSHVRTQLHAFENNAVSRIHKEVNSRHKSAIRTEYTEKEKKAALKITAAARGFLVRRLLKTQRVQHIKKTIGDTLQCAMSLQNDVSLNASDMELHTRLIQQLTAACYELYETFFSLTTKEKLNIISHDRERLKNIKLAQMLKNEKPVTMKTTDRIRRNTNRTVSESKGSQSVKTRNELKLGDKLKRSKSVCSRDSNRLGSETRIKSERSKVVRSQSTLDKSGRSDSSSARRRLLLT